MTARPTPRTPLRQGDLFEERGAWCGDDIAPQNDEANPETLDDQNLVEQVAKAKLSSVHVLCAQIIERDLGDAAVPGLVALWNRFKGFGITTPLPEQRLALQTLSAIGSDTAKAAIRKILVAPDLPDSLLPIALQTAATVALNLPQGQIRPWLEHDAPAVRALAFTLIQQTNPPQDILEAGFMDPDPSVRRAALIAAGSLGHRIARDGLLCEFRKNPTSQTIQALVAIADEEIVVEVGRYALANSAHKALIADELDTLEHFKAKK